MKTFEYVQEFLDIYDSMYLEVPSDKAFILKGQLMFSARDEVNNFDIVNEIVYLRIEVPFEYPSVLPEIFEEKVGEVVPRDSSYHKYENGKFCLGSPRNLHEILAKNPSLVIFVERTLVPLIVAAKYKKAGHNTEPFIYGELAHGEQGLKDDFRREFNLDYEMEEMVVFFELLSLKKRVANKHLCACNSGLKVSRCVCHRAHVAARNKTTYSRRLYRAIADDYKNILASTY